MKLNVHPLGYNEPKLQSFGFTANGNLQFEKIDLRYKKIAMCSKCSLPNIMNLWGLACTENSRKW